MKKYLTVIIAIITLFISLGFLFVGMSRLLKVYDDEKAIFYHRVMERQVVIDATFSGVIRKGDRLISTYNRAEKVGRRPCPT